MKIWRLLLVMCVLWGAGMMSSLYFIRSNGDNHLDMVAVNQILQEVIHHWEQPEQGDYSNIQLAFAVIDTNEQLLYTSDHNNLNQDNQATSTINTSIHEALKNRDTIIDVKQDEQILGKIIIQNNAEIQMLDSQHKLTLVITLTFVLLFIMSATYLFFVKHTIITPFNKLQHFAAHIAKGNLDVPLPMHRSNPFGAFTESFDIMREELAKARQSEYEANRSKKELVASLSHDIKTPVASIKAISELMLLRTTDEKAMKQLTMIHTKAEQINVLVTDMFHATLEELQELKVQLTEEYSSKIITMIENINFDDQITYGSVPDCILLMDPVRLQQVFDNVLSNAYKYAASSITITFAVDSSFLYATINDYGNGVPPEELPLLFNKFYRGSNTAGRNGAGLGLFISQYLMHQMQGDIECYNREDGFTVRLKIRLART